MFVMKFGRKGLVLMSIILSSVLASAENKITTKPSSAQTGVANSMSSTETVNAVSADQMRCEKLNSTTLAEFKKALVENCNLNKPFSSSLSRILNDEVYFYCCHKK